MIQGTQTIVPAGNPDPQAEKIREAVLETLRVDLEYWGRAGAGFILRETFSLHSEYPPYAATHHRRFAGSGIGRFGQDHGQSQPEIGRLGGDGIDAALSRQKTCLSNFKASNRTSPWPFLHISLNRPNRLRVAHLLKAVASQWSAECFGWASGDGLLARMQKSLPAESRFGSEREFTGFLTEQVDNGFLNEAKGRMGIVPLSETLFNLSPALGEFFIWSRKLGPIHDAAIAADGADARPGRAPGGNDARRDG